MPDPIQESKQGSYRQKVTTRSIGRKITYREFLTKNIMDAPNSLIIKYVILK